MIHIKLFIFNPFQVNTWVLYEESGAAVIIDPGCYSQREEQELAGFIEKQGLTPVWLLNTHTHIDHILGNAFVHGKFGLVPACHPDGQFFIANAEAHGRSFGLQVGPVCEEIRPLGVTDTIKFGDSLLRCLHTPGHAPGSLCFHAVQQDFVITGDLIFFESIGRFDLPGGDYDLLEKSIRENIYPLAGHTVLYPGHGHETTVEHERMYNPFVSAGDSL